MLARAVQRDESASWRGLMIRPSAPELFFLVFAVALAQLAALSVADVAGEGVAAFATACGPPARERCGGCGTARATRTWLRHVALMLVERGFEVQREVRHQRV